jgi:two-component system OmpR family sensor kinase
MPCWTASSRSCSSKRRFAADAGHELRTPLTVLRAELELANRPGRSLDELQEAVGFAVVETDRLIHLAEQLLLLARADEADHRLVARGDEQDGTR